MIDAHARRFQKRIVIAFAVVEALVLGAVVLARMLHG